MALCRLNKTAEAAKLAAGPDGQTPCGYQTLRHSGDRKRLIGWKLEGKRSELDIKP